MLKGLGLPNREWDAYTPAELAALDDLAPAVVIVLLYGSPIDQTHAAQLDPYLSSHRPRLLYRPYADDIPTIEPSVWAQRCALLAGRFGHPGEMIPANEMNLASEHGSEDWSRQIAWLSRFAASWWKLAPNVPLHLPALSPSGAWQDGLRAYAAAKLDLLFDRIDCHAYGDQAAEIVRATAAILRGPLDLTEFNQTLPARLDPVSHLLESASWFTLGGEADQAAYDLLRHPADYQAFKGWRPKMPTTTFNVGPGVLALMASHGDHPKSDEHYVLDANGQTFKSETFGSKGIYQWNKQANETVYIPFG